MRSLGKATLIVACWLVVWQLLAFLVDNRWLLCEPLETAQAWGQLALTSAFWLAIGNSLLRIVIGFFVAFIAGVVLGFLAAKLPLLRDVLRPLVTVVKSAPVVCIIALLLVGTGANAATSIVVGLVVFPQFYHAVIEALGTENRTVDEALQVFGVSRARTALYVEFVALGSSLRAACAVAAGLAWKSGIAAELIGLPALSIGTGVYLGKISLDSATIIAWTATVILLSWLSEKLLLALVDAIVRLPRRALARQVRRALGNEVPSLESVRPVQARPHHAIRIDELVRRFAHSDDGERPGETALIYRDVEIEPGARVCVMAPSGAGKTTLLRIVAGVERADEGALRFEAADDASTRRPSMSVEFQDCSLLPWASALENLALTARDADEIRRGAAFLTQVLDEDALGKPVSALSGGMKRRAELCRALAHDGELLILDEPFAGIDEATKLRCVELIRQTLGGRTLLVATHDPNDAPLLDADVLKL